MDYEQLRRDLMNYFGTASPYHPVALMDVAKVESASHDQLIRIALQNGFNLDRYK